MEKENYNKLKKKLQDREMVRTNFGPEEDDATIRRLTNMKSQQTAEMKNGLMNQIS